MNKMKRNAEKGVLLFFMISYQCRPWQSPWQANPFDEKRDWRASRFFVLVFLALQAEAIADRLLRGKSAHSTGNIAYRYIEYGLCC